MLEKGVLPSGASTKNAGISVFAFLGELLDDFKEIGEKKALEVVKLRYDGLKLLKQRFDLKNNSKLLKECGCYELI